MPEFANLISGLMPYGRIALYLLSLVGVGWIGKKIYTIILKNPAKVFFLIPDRRYEVNYVDQDDDEHLVKELILPPESKNMVLIWYRPKVNYFEDSHYFGCEPVEPVLSKKPRFVSHLKALFKKPRTVNHLKALSTKPRIVNSSNPFVISGNLQRSYYVDWHHYYHILTNKNRIKDEVYVYGFEVQTFSPGKYEANVYVHTPQRLGRAKLKITVTGNPSESVLCYSYKDERRKIKHFLKKRHEKAPFGCKSIVARAKHWMIPIS